VRISPSSERDRIRKRDRPTDGRTNRRTDRSIALCLPLYRAGHKKWAFVRHRKQASVGTMSDWWRRNSVERLDVDDTAVQASRHPACEQSSVKLSPTQRRLCRLNPDHMASVSAGLQLSTQECRHQLEWRRWNCTTSPINSSLTDSTAAVGNSDFRLDVFAGRKIFAERSDRISVAASV